MPVPMLDLRAQYQALKPEIDAAVAAVFARQQFIGGPEVEALEREMAAFTGAREAVGVASGTDALLLALRAAGIGPGDEVVTSPFTFFATAGAVVNAGAEPVFVDIEPDTYNLDPEAIEARLSCRTRALLPVHLFGHCADMDAIAAIAAARGLPVLEDAAQALGAQIGGRQAGAMGLAGALSFFPSKNLGGAGDGGMVLTNDADFARQVRLLRNHGADAQYEHEIVGTNSRLDALQAAVLRVKLRHLPDWIEARRARATRYAALLAELDEVQAPGERTGCVHARNYYVIRLPRRDDAVVLLRERGIGCAVYYPKPLHEQPCFAHLDYKPEDCPVASRVSREVLALPIYPELTDAQQDAVVLAIKDHLARGRSHAGPATAKMPAANPRA